VERDEDRDPRQPGDDEAFPDACRLIRWLAEQPQDATVLWTDWTLDESPAFGSGWLDIHFGGEAGPNSVLTLSAPGEADDSEDPLDSVEITYDATWEVRFDDGNVVEMRIVPDDAAPRALHDARMIDELQDEIQWSTFWRRALSRDQHDRSRWSQRVWTLERIDLALRDWAARFAGREDLRFSFAAPTIETPADESDDEARPAEGEHFVQIGDGVRAHTEVLDQLLAMDPEDAAEITRDMQRRADEIRSSPLHRPGE
jgi:hypothetical protein